MNADHDYDPSWDYTLARSVKGGLGELLEGAREEIKAICEELQMREAQIYFVRGLKGALGRFVCGTNSSPVVVLDERAIRAAARRWDVDLGVALRTTIHHELGHAFVESCGLEMEIEEEEVMVEEFANRIWRGDGVRACAEWLKDSIAAVQVEEEMAGWA